MISIAIQYNTAHTLPEDDTTFLTVPDEHLEALNEFVKWQAIKRLEMDELISPDTKNLVLSELGINAVRAERVYSLKIAAYQKMRSTSKVSSPWKMDDKDRIY